MTEDIKPAILPVPIDKVLVMWPFIGPHLNRSIEMDPTFDPDEAIQRVFQGLTQLWAVFRGTDVIASFATTIVNDGDYPGEKALEIHGLGGSEFVKWREIMAEVMIEWGQANDCHRIIFHGRKCLIRSHACLGDLRMTHIDEQTGHAHFERML